MEMGLKSLAQGLLVSTGFLVQLQLIASILISTNLISWLMRFIK